MHDEQVVFETLYVSEGHFSNKHGEGEVTRGKKAQDK